MNCPRFPWRQIGPFSITVLNDGNMSASLDLLSGIEYSAASRVQQRAGYSDLGNIHINCYLIRTETQTVLVDTGTGGLNHAGGLLIESLAVEGVKPEDIDIILLTHGHPDHIGGLLSSQGTPIFPDAELYLHEQEAAYWLDDENEKVASERAKQNFSRIRRMLRTLAPRVHLINEDDMIAGIRPVWLPGHTPGHTGFRLDSAEESLLIWGDIVHFPHIQSAYPDVSVAFDVDPRQARETRKAVMELAVRENLLIAGMHLDAGGFVYVTHADGGYKLSL